MIPPRRMRPAALSSAAIVLALGAAGCLGGGGSSSAKPALTRAQYVSAAGAICRHYQGQIAALKPTTNLALLADQGAKAVALERAELKQLRKLEPPSADAVTIGRLLDAVDSATVAGDALVAAARSHNTAAVAAAVAVLRGRLAEANRLAKPYGLDICAR
ncbi:MAG: hypothetical protein QOJ31_2016 [Gaiellales bacterium]|nr:hypothetical protein [Gaiellales bacterium]